MFIQFCKSWCVVVVTLLIIFAKYKKKRAIPLVIMPPYIINDNILTSSLV